MNLGQLEARVRYPLGDANMRSIPPAQILDLLKEAEVQLLTEIPYKRIHASFTFDYSATESWKVPVDPNWVRLVRVCFDDRWLTIGDTEDMQAASGRFKDTLAEQRPDLVVLWNHQLQLWPHPDSSHDGATIEVWAVKAHSDLTDQEDEPYIPAAYHSCLVDYAVMNLASDVKLMQAAQGRYEWTARKFRSFVNRTMPPVHKTRIG
jgi:hypothetical protein